MSNLSPNYPVRLEVDFPSTPSRGLALLWLLLFPKAILLLPHVFVLYFVNLAAAIVVFVGYLVVLVTGRYPPGLFDFVLGTMRWQTRVNAWLFGLVDEYPPFSLH